MTAQFEQIRKRAYAQSPGESISIPNLPFRAPLDH